MYAVIETGGKQYTVAEGQTIQVERMSVEEGATVNLDRVLMVSRDDNILIGTPLVKGAKVVAQALGEGKSRKIIVFKYKRKTKYRKKTGHRQPFTNLLIKNITVGARRTKARQA
ncbi:MAG: 50S ribosomal protein L21 [Chloroflexota bacterium]|nr:50S ribosomal protein L21 [Chloroflexota bacterium]